MRTGLRPGATNCFFISPVRLFIRFLAFALIVLLGTIFQSNAQTINGVSVAGTPVCAGTTVVVNFNVINGNGSSNYFKNSTQYQAYISDATGVSFVAMGLPFSISAAYPTSNGGSVGVQATVTIPSTLANGTGYEISIGSSSPLFNGSTGTNASAAFTVNAPTVTVVSNDADNSICAGTSVTFTATPNNATNPGYQWQLNNANISGATAATYTTTTLANADQIKVIMTSAGSCATFPTVSSNSIPMTVNTAVVPSVTISANPGNTICPGNSVSFNSTVVNGGSAIYQWLLNGSPIPGANAATYTTTALTNGQIISLNVTSNAACVSPAAATSTGITMAVNAATPAQPGTITGAAVVCPGVTGLTYSISAVTNATSYTWSVPTGWSITAGQNSTSSTITSGTAGQNGNVTITASNSCGTGVARTLAVTVSSATPSQPGAITGASTVCPSMTGLVYSITSVPNASAYTWTVPTGWSITGGQNSTSLTVTGGTAGQDGNISVTATNSCGTSTIRTFAVLVNNPTPAQPGIITGAAVACPGVAGLNYSITAVTNATSYTWVVPTGWIITAGQNTTSLTVTSGTAGQNGNITVTAINSCGTSIARTLGLTVSPATPAQPGTITGTAIVCPSLTGLGYSIASVTNATSYTWSVPAGWSITSGQNSTAVTATSGTAGQNGNITVTSNNSCGTSTVRTLALTVSPATPAQPGMISGTSLVCSGVTGLNYNISAVANATSYTWAVPTGWSITAGQNATSITVTSGSAGQNGNITVTASNSCGTSTIRTLAVNVSPATPAQPGVITGTSAVCPSITGLNYSIASVTNATSYTWSAPIGWSITGGQNSTSLTVTSGTSGQNGNITVTASNICGTSTVRTLAVTVSSSAPVQPGPITGSNNACVNITGLTYSVTAVAGATGYNWILPSGWSITAGANTNSITVSTSLTAMSGDISVSATNSCGISGFQTMLLTVNPVPVVNAVSNQTVCNGAPVTAISFGGPVTGSLYNWTSNTTSIGIASSGTGNMASFTAVNPGATPVTATITVTPSFTNGSVTCMGSQKTFTITVNPTPLLTTQSLDSACTGSSPNVLLTSNIPGTFTWIVGANNGAIMGATNGNGSTINQVLTNPSSTAVGSVGYIVTPTSTVGSCAGAATTIMVNVYPPSAGGVVLLDAVALPSDVILVCPYPASSVTGGMTVQSNKVGSILYWQYSNDGASWSTINNTATTNTFQNLTNTTSYRAAIKSGSCGIAYSSIVVVSVVPASPPSPVQASPATICVGDTSVLSASIGFGVVGIPASAGNFNQGNPAGWCVDNQCNSNSLPASGNNENNAPFNETNGPKNFGGIRYDTYDNTKFAITGGNFSNPAPMGPNTTWMITPAFNLLGLPSATLNFYHAYNLTAGASVRIDVSTDGGTTFNPLQVVNGPAQLGINNAATPLPTGALQPVNVSLNAYLGLTNIKIRFRFISNATSSWAIDGVEIPSSGMPANFLWTQTTPGPNTLIPVQGGSGTTIFASPSATTIYQIQTSVGGCPGGMQIVTVGVNPTPTITPGITGSVCASPNSQTTSLAYSGVTANPTSYSLSWNNTPSNNFGNVANAPIGASATGSINLTVPAGTLPGTYTGWIKVRNGNSCRSDSSSFTITVNPRPTAVITGTSTICQGQSASFSIPVTGSGVFSGTLSNGANFNSAGSSPVPITVSPATTTTYTLATLTNGTCSSLTSDLAGSHTVAVNMPVAISSQPTSEPVCLHHPSGIKTRATGTTPSFLWEVNDGSGWATVVNGPDYTGATTDSLTVTNPRIEMLFYQYRNKVSGSGPCNVPALTAVADVKIRNVWLGTVDTNWQNGANWSGGVVPTVICDTVHILNRTLQPVLSSGTSTITNLLIHPGADIVVANQPDTYLEVAGSIVNNNTLPGINALNGRLVLNGTLQPQNIKGSLFTQRILNYLTISNTTAGGASLSGAPTTDTLYISNHLDFGNVNARTFTTNDNLTLMSRSNLTASVGDLTNNGLNQLNIISGRVTVERWINARKAWRFLAVPTSGPQTFRSSWQEKMLTPNDNRFPGYGTTITIGTTANYVANGFDFYDVTGPSVKTYVPSTNTYVGITNSANDMTSSKGYMIFIRGNRSSTSYNSPVTSTVLRTSGPLIQGTRPPVSVGSFFNDVANPYASPIDMRKINKPGVQEFIYLWNPNMSGGFGLGAFQTYLLDDGNYTPVPDDGTAPDNFIQSGQAFFVAGFGTAGAGTVNIEESDKEFQSNMLLRKQGMAENMKANLKIVNNNNATTLVDGLRVDFADSWSNAVDMYDAIKMQNLSENVSSLRENKMLSVERRKTVAETDTIFVKLTGLRVMNYRWSIALANMDSAGRTADLIDSYTNTRTALALDDTTDYNFSVQNIPGSYATGRFMIVFKQLPPPTPPAPVLITSISASRNHDNSIALDWRVQNEANVKEYTLERSADGSAFQGIITKDANSNNGSTNNYNANDQSPLTEDNFYRVRALLQNGHVVYSQIVKVDPLPFDVGITVFPNPVRNKTLHIKFAGQEKGIYSISLNNKLGQVIHQSKVMVNNNISSVDIRLSSYVTSGTYQVQIISPAGEVTRQQVFIE